MIAHSGTLVLLRAATRLHLARFGGYSGIPYVGFYHSCQVPQKVQTEVLLLVIN